MIGEFTRTAPAFSEFSNHLYLAFPVRAFRNAQLLWLNKRWMTVAGLAVDQDGCDRFGRWLLDRYAVGVPQPSDPDTSYSGGWRTMYADRYGSNAGSTQGGSGRVGTLGLFNAKGIGQTPLVSPRTDWYHSHGCLWLEEAIREAINSEIAAVEFPHGAIPTIAVIDTGERINWAPGDSGERRAILVRPAFLRLASLQRSIFFGDAGHAGTAQYVDAQRMRDLWRAIFPPQADAWGRLHGLFERIGEQYGAGNAKRLWPGPLFSSNVTLTGALTDFGGFRAVWSWKRGRGHTQTRDFGGEQGFAETTARALAMTAAKHGHTISADSLIAAFTRGRAMGFGRALPHPRTVLDEGMAALFRTSFARQQRIRCEMGKDDGDEWLADAEGGAPAGSPVAQQERALLDARWDAAGGTSVALAAFLRPRHLIIRERLLHDCQALIADMDDQGAVSPARVAAFIEERISAPSSSMGRMHDEPDHAR
jgi:hypothetical protein